MDWITFLIEVIFEGICGGWMYLMQRIVPDKMENKTFRIVLKILVGVFSLALLVSVFIGVFCLLSEDVQEKQIGKYMVFIPLVIGGLQIIGGIAARIAAKRK